MSAAIVPLEPQISAGNTAAAAAAGAGSPNPHGNDAPQSGSKFKRFLRKFGRKPSDEVQSGGDSAGSLGVNNNQDSVDGYGQNGGRSEGGLQASSDTSAGKTSKRRGNSLLGGRNNSKPTKSAPTASKPSVNRSTQQQQSHPEAPGPSQPVEFSNSGAQGLADTLALPEGDEMASPPPQIGGLPSHEPITPIELSGAGALSAAPASAQAFAMPANSTYDSASQHRATHGSSDAPQSGTRAASTPVGPASPSQAVISESSGSPARSRDEMSFDSTEGLRKRDSGDNRTIDTGKSTKPTTLMSMETREHSTGPMAHIAQYRGEDTTPSLPSPGRSTNGAGAVPASSSSGAIQFATPPPQRGPTGGTTATPTAGESPYINIPAVSRPHPSNNPHPSAQPPDNASVLTLASSTGAQSLGGGAASSRGGGHQQTPSLGGARSIGGSMMGDRRNSSDTYASVKALPPLSRRGSDESTRTGRDSVAASASGLNSAQAMTVNSPTPSNAAAPGAPRDRMSMQRTPSQRTVATQLSVPIGTPAAASPAANVASGVGTSAPVMPGNGERRVSSGSSNLLSGQGSSGIGAAGMPAGRASVEQLHQHQLSQSQKLDDDHEDNDSDGKTGAVQTPQQQQQQQQRQQVSEAQQLEVPAITQTAPSPTEEKQDRMAGLAGSN